MTAGRIRRRNAERTHIRHEPKTLRAGMEASILPSTSRDSGMLTLPTMSAIWFKRVSMQKHVWVTPKPRKAPAGGLLV